MKTILGLLTVIVFSLSISSAYAQDGGKDKASQQLEFEEGLIEGVSKKIGDFASVTTADRNRPKEHLYRRVFSWKRERDEVIREMRYSQ